eukprot:2680395-Rhodomonas_salina.3
MHCFNLRIPIVDSVLTDPAVLRAMTYQHIVLRATTFLVPESSTDIAYAASYLRACYAMSGTELAYGATRSAWKWMESGSLLVGPTLFAYAISLCICYAVSGTELAYASTLCHAMSGTDIEYAATRPRPNNADQMPPRAWYDLPSMTLHAYSPSV